MSTNRQTKLLAYLRCYLADHNGLSPSYDEMQQALGMRSKSNIHIMLDALKEQGFIRRLPGRHRSIQIVEPDQIKATLALKEIVEHWDRLGPVRMAGLIERVRWMAA